MTDRVAAVVSRGVIPVARVVAGACALEGAPVPVVRRGLVLASLALAAGLASCGGSRTSVPPHPAAQDAASIDSTPTIEDSLVSYRVPPFRNPSWATWGPLPPGVARPARVPAFDLQHQIVRVSFDWRRRAVIGSTTLRIAAASGGSALERIALDAVAMRIRAVRGEGDRALRHEYDGERLVIHLGSPLTGGRRTNVTVDYEVERPARGIYFVERRRTIWTQGQAEDTRYWLPTYDHPSQRTSWEMFVRVPRGQRVLSNGTLAAEREMGREMEFHWTLERTAPTYLMSIVAGDYVVLQDRWRTVPLGYWTYADSVEATWRGLRRTPEMIELFSQRTGVPYPWSTYDQAAVPDFIYGGMENVTASTMADDRILAPRWAAPHVATEALVAHELIHQWFGNMISAKDWSHIWLHEGFARFFEAVYQEVQGENESTLSRLATVEAAIAADRRARRPLVHGRYVHDPMELILSGHVYSRGAVALDMLRRELGDSAFWRGMRTYAARHRFSTVETADFRRAMEEAGGGSLERFFSQWVHGAGHPFFAVRFDYDSASRRLDLVAAQVQPRDSLTRYFSARVDVEILTARGPKVLQVHVRDSLTRIVDTLRAPPLSIRWNTGERVLAATDFPRSTAMLRHQLEHSDDLTARVEAVALLAERGGESMARAALARAATEQAVWLARARAAEALGSLAPDSGALAALLAASRDEDPRVRLAAAGSLAGYDDALSIARVRALLESDESLFVRAAALRAYAALRPAEAKRLLPDLLARDSWMDMERTMALEALAVIGDPGGRELARPFLAREHSRRARTAAIGALAVMREARPEEYFALLAPLLDDADVIVRQAVAAALGGIGEGPAAARARAALERRLTIERQLRVIQALERALAPLDP